MSSRLGEKREREGEPEQLESKVMKVKHAKHIANRRNLDVDDSLQPYDTHALTSGAMR